MPESRSAMSMVTGKAPDNRRAVTSRLSPNASPSASSLSDLSCIASRIVSPVGEAHRGMKSTSLIADLHYLDPSDPSYVEVAFVRPRHRSVVDARNQVPAVAEVKSEFGYRLVDD